MATAEMEVPGPPITNEEVAEELQALSETEKAQLKRDALADLYIFSKGICGYKDVNAETHGAFCRFLDSNPKKRRLGLMPRTHLKSTIGTVADSARLALLEQDFSGLIVGETETTAVKFLSETKQHFEQNKIIRLLWPERIPSRFTGPGVKWSNTEASLLRDNIKKENTWSALGVGGAVVGSHFKRIKGDDLIGFEAYRSPAAMKAAIAWVDNIEPLLVDQHNDIIDFIGTRWATVDLYSHIMDTYEGTLSVFTRSAIEDGKIIFPQLHTWEEYQRLQTKTPLVWFAQYVNDPRAEGGTDFSVEKVGFFQFTSDGKAVRFRDVLTGSEKEWLLSQLDIVLTADPNSGSLLAPDMAAIAVTGISPDDEVFTLTMWSGRVTPSDFVEKIFSVAQQWKPRIVGIEEAGQQNTKHYFEKKLMEEDISFRVVPLKPYRGRQTKEDRIRGNLQPVIDGGQLYTLQGHTVLRKQIADFPQNARYDNALIDELDALAYGPDVWKKPMRTENMESRVKKIKLLLRRRSSITGY